MTITNNNGLNPEPWCLPTFTSKKLQSSIVTIYEIFTVLSVTGRIARHTEADLGVVCPAMATRCIAQGEIWRAAVAHS